MRFTRIQLWVLLILGVGIGAFPRPADAIPAYLTQFMAKYPAAGAISSCTLCHTASGPPNNAYGSDFASHNHDFAAIENLDSDGDGWTNIQEINAAPPTLPGDPASHPPGQPPDTQPPTVTAFTLPATSTSLTVPITSFTATDNVGVTGFMVTESSTAPAAGASGWTATAQTSFTFGSAGAKTLFAWAKDAAGNVSASRSATTTITLSPAPDTQPPTVTSFTLPAAATSLTVPITSFTATDNVGVTGFMATESSTAPTAAAAGWMATAPTSFTFGSAGAKTLFAWAKDAAGNVSAPLSATTTITLPPTTTDTQPPTVTSFTLPASATSLTVPITSFTATDNVGVTGFMVTESSTAPAAGASGWTATAPTNFTFGSAGAKTLFAWAKDAAGNVSASRSATTTITLPPNPTGGPETNAMKVGYAVITATSSSSTFTVFETFGLTGYGDTCDASLFAPDLTTQADLFVRTSRRLARNIGVAIVNPSNTNTNITISLKDNLGTLIGTDTFTLGAFQQTARFVTQLFNMIASWDVTGTITISSTSPVAMVGLRFRGHSFSTLPVTNLTSPTPVPVISPGVGGPGSSILPQFVAGGGWASQIVVSNPGTTPITVQVDLFQQDGTPLTTTLNGVQGSSFTGITIPAGGVVTLAPLNPDGDDDF